MVFSEPNVEVTNIVSEEREVSGSINSLYRTYTPSCITKSIECLCEKKEALVDAVKEKISTVFDACERIAEHYIPDDTFVRVEMNANTDVFTRMGAFSYELSTRICNTCLPFVTSRQKVSSINTNKTQVKQSEKSHPFAKSIRDPLVKVTEQCIEKVKPVVSVFTPVVAPLFSLFLLIITTIVLIIRKLFIDPLLYIFYRGKSFYMGFKDEFVTDDEGQVPIMTKAISAYNIVISDVYPLFVNEKGMVTLTHFQKLCKTKRVEYQQLLKENVTEENLRAFLGKTGNQVKIAVKEHLAPIRENEKAAKEYYSALVSIFADENGQFTISKIEQMVGESGNQLKTMMTAGIKKLLDGKDFVVKNVTETAETMTNDITSRFGDVKSNALTVLSLVLGLILLFPTIGLLMIVFVLSLFINIDEITPSPALKKLLKAVDRMDAQVEKGIVHTE